MNKAVVVVIICAVVVALAGAVFLIKKPSSNIDDVGLILFYGDGCVHCANVDKFIADNNVSDKVQFIKKEVFNDAQNARQLIDKGEFCKIPAEYLGAVPLLWNGSDKTCVFGETDIIKFFQDKINVINSAK